MKRSTLMLLIILLFVAPSCKHSNSATSNEVYGTNNVSDHDLIISCQCGSLGLQPNRISSCGCKNITVFCHQHGNSLFVDRRTSVEVLCTGVPNGLYAK